MGTIRHCDRCKSVDRVEPVMPPHVYEPEKPPPVSIDLCHKCREKVDAFVKWMRGRGRLPGEVVM